MIIIFLLYFHFPDFTCLRNGSLAAFCFFIQFCYFGLDFEILLITISLYLTLKYFIYFALHIFNEMWIVVGLCTTQLCTEVEMHPVKWHGLLIFLIKIALHIKNLVYKKVYFLILFWKKTHIKYKRCHNLRTSHIHCYYLFPMY